MNTRDMWENQVELLSRHCRTLSDQVDQLEERLTYFEGVIITLITALKDGGIIVDSQSSDSKTYDC
jgi:chaperonin cofactor prefoldin